MIVVFSHGDVLDEDTSLDQLLGTNCPQPLMSTLKMCGNRIVVVDNKRGDKVETRNEIVSLVDYVVDNNGGKPYTNDLFDEVKRREMSLVDQASKVNSTEWKLPGSNDEQFERFVQMVETRLKESILKLEKQLVEAEAKVEEMREWLQRAEVRAEERCKPGNTMSEMMNNMINDLKKNIRELHEKIRQRQKDGNCVIM